MVIKKGLMKFHLWKVKITPGLLAVAYCDCLIAYSLQSMPFFRYASFSGKSGSDFSCRLQFT